MNVRPSKTRKKDYQKSVRVNTTLPPALHEEVPSLLRKYGFTDFSGYIQARLRKDLGLDLPT